MIPWYEGLINQEDSALPRVSKFLSITNGMPVSAPLIRKQTNPEPIVQITFSTWLLYSRRQHFLALTIPGPDTRQLGTVPIAQSPKKWSTLAKPDLLTLPHLFLLPQKHNKGSYPCPPLTPSASWLTIMLHHVAPSPVVWPGVLWHAPSTWAL